METIASQKIWTFPDGASVAETATCGAIRKANAHHVRDYMDLATKVAELQFQNRDFVLLFRGQPGDFKNSSKNTSLKPTIMRADADRKLPTKAILEIRFKTLREAEIALVREYDVNRLLGGERLKRQQILRWSILQHYEICPTPLLDVTQSLRIAASFASSSNPSEAFVFVLGLPHISGAITASAEAGVQIVRLASVCPPTAVRPHIQEGYLLGEYPDLSGVDQKQHYAHFEMDFGRRLIAKFRFDPQRFWGESGYFPQVPHDALYPSQSDDPLCRLAGAVKATLA